MSNEEQIKKAAQIIKQGGIVIFPTETVYGIGTNGFNEKAIEKLYKLKQRKFNKPISLLVSDIEMVEMVAKDITEIEYKLMKEFFPGPLTLVLKRKETVPDILTANGDTVGIRISNNEIVRKLIKYANISIATSSANIAGESEGVNIKNITKEFEGKVDYIIDNGKVKYGIGSTVVQVIENIPHILREGVITKEQILNVFH